ncbi:MAG: hypothetical protein QXN55_00095 [Candidatus Nitrosotenuis sp.]
MKIIGDYIRDYYDVARKSGHDEGGHIFMRNSEIKYAGPASKWNAVGNCGAYTDGNHELDFIFEGTLVGSDYIYRSVPTFDVTIDKVRRQLTLGYRRVLFCTSIKVHRPSSGSGLGVLDPNFKYRDDNYFYTAETLQHYFDQYQVVLKKKSESRHY